MRKILAIILGLAGHNLLAQHHIGLNAGIHINTINFKNSNGEKETGIVGIPSYYLDATLQLSISKRSRNTRSNIGFNHSFLVSLGYKKGMSKNVESSFLETWSMEYISSTLMYRLSKQSKKGVAPYFGGGIVFDYLVSGIQQSGIEQYDLTRDLKKSNTSLALDAGISYWISDHAYGTFGATYGFGLSNLEEGTQSLRINQLLIGLAVYFEISQ